MKVFWTRRSKLAAAAVIAVVLALTGCGPASTNNPGAAPSNTSTHNPTIAVALLAQNTQFDINVDALKAAVLTGGVKNAKYETFNAQGDVNNVSLIVKRIVDLKPDLIYAVGTPLIQALVHATTDIPIVFGIMGDPVGAGVVKSLDNPGGNVTGTVGTVPPAFVFDVVTKTMPGIRRVGLIGNISEQNTQFHVATLKAEAAKRSISVVVAPITSTNDVQLAVKSLDGKVDALVIPADSTVVSAITVAVEAATNVHLPTFSPGGSNLADNGVMVAMGPSYTELGTQAGALAVKIFGGTSAGGLSVVIPDASSVDVKVHSETASQLGIKVPSTVASK